MQLVLVMDLSHTDEISVHMVRKYVLEFVGKNTMLINKAVIYRVADAGDLAMDERTTVLRLGEETDKLEVA